MITKIITAILFSLSTQAFAAQIDVLFVIDDSGSMYTYQAMLAAAAPTYAAEFARKGDDVNLAVISTSMEGPFVGSVCCGVFKGRTNSKLPTFESDMANLFKIGTSGSGFEKPLEALNTALEKTATDFENAHFFRHGSEVRIVFITDAYDQSAIQPRDVLQTISRMVDLRRVTISGAIIPLAAAAPTCPRDDQGATGNDNLEVLIGATGGKIIDLCNPNFAVSLFEIL